MAEGQILLSCGEGGRLDQALSRLDQALSILPTLSTPQAQVQLQMEGSPSAHPHLPCCRGPWGTIPVCPSLVAGSSSGCISPLFWLFLQGSAQMGRGCQCLCNVCAHILRGLLQAEPKQPLLPVCRLRLALTPAVHRSPLHRDTTCSGLAAATHTALQWEPPFCSTAFHSQRVPGPGSGPKQPEVG